MVSWALVASPDERTQSQHPGTRYLLVRGKSTSLRHALPPFGTVTIGRSEKNDVTVNEPGVADEHLVIHVDFGIGVRALDSDSEVDAGGRISALSSKETVDLELQDRVRIGTVEIGFGAHEPFRRRHRVWAPAYFEERLQEEMAAGDNVNLTVLRFAIDGLREDETEAAFFEHLDPKHMLTELGTGDYAVLAAGIGEETAQALAGRVAQAMAERGGDVSFGTAVPADGDASSLLDVAERRIKRAASGGATAQRLVMDSTAMQEVARMVDQVARTSSHVLILGETGVGKEVVAQMIHDRSDRAGRPFVRVSCVDLEDRSIEEADEGEEPLLFKAQGGTLLLDEVGGLSPRAQLSLGHLLEKWAASSRTSRRQAVRVIATSNQDLEAAVAAGTFRKDLIFRLNGVTIPVPPLREHLEDVGPLARAFVERTEGAKQIEDGVLRALESYSWPGNVRELRNVVERAAMMARSDTITLADLPDQILGGKAPPPPVQPAAKQAAAGDGGAPKSLREEMAELEKRRILEALEKYPTQTDAAKALDIPLRTFLNRLDALGIPRARKAKKK